jgi:hypothetical protein
MDKNRYLSVANSIRRDRLHVSNQAQRFRFMETESAVSARFCDLAAKLVESEKQALLNSLKSSLEKERRRKLGRKASYDPGRHIGLYLAVKSLSQHIKPPD